MTSGPMGTPTARDSDMTVRPILSDMRAPKITRVKMSRPSASAPNRCRSLRGCSLSAKLIPKAASWG